MFNILAPIKNKYTFFKQHHAKPTSFQQYNVTLTEEVIILCQIKE